MFNGSDDYCYTYGVYFEQNANKKNVVFFKKIINCVASNFWCRGCAVPLVQIIINM